MAIMEYGIGGNEVKIDASEAIADIPGNRSLIVEQLTNDEPVNPEVVTGLTNMDQVFAHYKPNVEVSFEDVDGQVVNEILRFATVADFSVKKMTAQSPFLSELSTSKGFYENLKKQLRSNKVLQRALENPETKTAFLNVLKAIAAELQTVDKD